MTEGTGVVVSKDGYVLTSKHLFERQSEDSKSAFRIKAIEGATGSREGRLEKLELIETHHSSDAALLKFVDTFRERSFARIGSPGAVNVGDDLTFEGVAGNEEWLATKGRLAGKNGPKGSWNVDLAFGPSSSGGPIFDEKNRLVAIVWGGIPGRPVDGLHRVLPVNLYANLLMVAGSDGRLGQDGGNAGNIDERQEREILSPGQVPSSREIPTIKLKAGGVTALVSDGFMLITVYKEAGFLEFSLSGQKELLPRIVLLFETPSRSHESGAVREIFEIQYALEGDLSKCVVKRKLGLQVWPFCDRTPTKSEMDYLPWANPAKINWKIPVNEVGDGNSVRFKVLLATAIMVPLQNYVWE